MYRILHKLRLSEVTTMMVIEARHVVAKAQAGQFIIIRIDERSERIPLTIADYDVERGTITIIFQEVGKSTLHLGSLEAGDELVTVVGPLGNHTEILDSGTVICVGGGVGIAPVFPIARALKEAGNTVISIIGARTKNLLFWEDRMRAVSDELIVCTDDGSWGRRALVTVPLKELLERRSIHHIWAIGPAIMMKFVAQASKPFNVPTTVSLNPIMVDGTGMCGCCRVLIDGEPRFACVDGPEFDGQRIDWDNLLARLQFYRDEEHQAVERWKGQCQAEAKLKKGGRQNA